MEAYRSGRNELDSKSSCPQGHVGSNPTASAKNPAEIKCFSGVFYVWNNNVTIAFFWNLEKYEKTVIR